LVKSNCFSDWEQTLRPVNGFSKKLIHDQKLQKSVANSSRPMITVFHKPDIQSMPHFEMSDHVRQSSVPRRGTSWKFQILSITSKRNIEWLLWTPARSFSPISCELHRSTALRQYVPDGH
jgi:hypothetical protein